MFFKKWPPVAILDVQKSLCIAFLTISNQYHNFYFCEIFLQNGYRRPFWMSEIHFQSHFWSIRNSNFFVKFLFLWNFFMAAVGQFGFPKFTMDHISSHLFFLNFFYKMAAGGPFGCPKFTLDHTSGHFRSIQNEIFYFSEIVYKMAAGRNFGCLKIDFDLISIHFTSIRNFNLFWKFLTKWLTSAILDVPNSLSIAFLVISDRYANKCLFEKKLQNGCRRPFWMSEIHFQSHFWPFQIDRPVWISEIHFQSQFWPFQIDTKKNSGSHFGCLKITLDRISDHFRLIGHFGCPEFTFDGISAHFRSIRNFFFFFLIFDKNGRRRPSWMSTNNFRSHFWPFQIYTIWQNGRRRPFWMGRQCQLLNLSEIFGWVMHVSSLKNVV